MAEKIKQKTGCWAEITEFRESENYIHPRYYKSAWPELTGNFIDWTDKNWLTEWKDKDVPTELSSFIKQEFIKGNIKLDSYSARLVKSKISKVCACAMKKIDFEEMGSFEEFDSFFLAIKEKLAT